MAEEDQELKEGTMDEGGAERRLFILTCGFPAVRKELIDLGSRCGRKAVQQVFGIFHGVDTNSVAGLNDAHPDGGRAASINRASEEPVLLSEHGGAKTVLRVIIVGGNEPCACVQAESIPVVEAVADSFAEVACRKKVDFPFSSVEPGLEEIEFRNRELLPKISTVFISCFSGLVLNIEQTLNDRKSVIDALLVFVSGSLHVAEGMGPASGMNGIDSQEIAGAVCLQDACETLQSTLGMNSLLRLGEVVVDVWLRVVAPVNPNVALVNLPFSFFEHWHGRVICLDDSGIEDQLSHSLDDYLEYIGSALEPAAHARPRDRHCVGAKEFLLPVERLVIVELGYADVGDQCGSGISLFDWSIGFWSENDITVASGAGIPELDVLEPLQHGFDDIELAGDLETDHAALNAAVGAETLFLRELVLDYFLGDGGLRSGATTAAGFLLRSDRESCALLFKQGGGFFVVDFAGASERSGRDLCGASAEAGPLLVFDLGLEVGDLLSELFNDCFERLEALNLGAKLGYDSMAFGKVIGEVVGIERGAFRHRIGLPPFW